MRILKKIGIAAIVVAILGVIGFIGSWFDSRAEQALMDGIALEEWEIISKTRSMELTSPWRLFTKPVVSVLVVNKYMRGMIDDSTYFFVAGYSSNEEDSKLFYLARKADQLVCSFSDEQAFAEGITNLSSIAWMRATGDEKKLIKHVACATDFFHVLNVFGKRYDITPNVLMGAYTPKEFLVSDSWNSIWCLTLTNSAPKKLSKGDYNICRKDLFAWLSQHETDYSFNSSHIAPSNIHYLETQVGMGLYDVFRLSIKGQASGRDSIFNVDFCWPNDASGVEGQDSTLIVLTGQED
jgi:hypothetical protein